LEELPIGLIKESRELVDRLDGCPAQHFGEIATGNGAPASSGSIKHGIEDDLAIQLSRNVGIVAVP
jgi:hypothetical protein